MKKSLIVCLLTICCLLPVFSGAQAAPDILSSLIRLHVLANSESLEDQQVKIIVRDELLAFLAPLLQGTSTQEEATTIIKAHLGGLARVAERSLQQQGKSYTANLQFGVFNFPDKHYGTFTLPAGRYQALNVTIGSGAGRNWWCVVFPPMCLTAGVCQPSEQTQATTYVLRSRLLEWGSSLWSWIFRRS